MHDVSVDLDGQEVTRAEADEVLREIYGLDPVFVRWTGEALQWLPEKGMGFFPTTGDPYDDDYYAELEARAATPLGREISLLRCALIERHTPISWGDTVIDIGIGCGQFVETLAERVNTRIYGFDKSRRGVAWLEERGLFRDPYEELVRVATFWDSLEHIPDAGRILANVEGWVFATLPVFDGPGHVVRSKHFKRDEHCWYWTRDGLIGWMEAYGFICREHNTAESLAGREDVGSFAFVRVG